jgi:hypothetical protein
MSRSASTLRLIRVLDLVDPLILPTTDNQRNPLLCCPFKSSEFSKVMAQVSYRSPTVARAKTWQGGRISDFDFRFSI